MPRKSLRMLSISALFVFSTSLSLILVNSPWLTNLSMWVLKWWSNSGPECGEKFFSHFSARMFAHVTGSWVVVVVVWRNKVLGLEML